MRALTLGALLATAFDTEAVTGAAFLAAAQEQDGELLTTMLVMGTVSGWTLAKDDAKQPVGFCFPPEAMPLDITKAVTEYIRAHTELQPSAATNLIIAAVRDTYPCDR